MQYLKEGAQLIVEGRSETVDSFSKKIEEDDDIVRWDKVPITDCSATLEKVWGTLKSSELVKHDWEE